MVLSQKAERREKQDSQQLPGEYFSWLKFNKKAFLLIKSQKKRKISARKSKNHPLFFARHIKDKVVMSLSLNLCNTGAGY